MKEYQKKEKSKAKRNAKKKKRLSERIKWRKLKKRKRRDLDGARCDRSDLSWAVRCDIEILIYFKTLTENLKKMI